MNIDDGIEFGIDGEAILFLGAGFSQGATNLNGESFKNGPQLAKYFAEECGIYEEISLEDAAEIYLDSKGEDNLINTLQHEFKTSKITESQKIIANLNWKNIYTTNYDNIFEFASQLVSINVTPITLVDDIYSIPKKEKLCMHINGYIDRLDRNNIFTEFKLTDTSYTSFNFANSQWSHQFRNDIKLAEVIFYVGYSLYDLDIRRILYETENLKNKSFFIIGKQPSKVLTLRISKFGKLIQEDCDSFATKMDMFFKNYVPKEKSRFKYTVLEEYHPPKMIKTIPDKAMFNLLQWGEINPDYVWISIQENNDQKYFHQRNENDLFFQFLNENVKNIIIHSDLGNGKTLFLEGIKCSAYELGYKIYSLNEISDQAFKEIEQIIYSEGKIIILIENYNNQFDLIQDICRIRTEKTILVLTARSLLHDVVAERLSDILRDDNAKEIDLNNLSESGIEWYFDLLTEFGFWGEDASLSKIKKLDILKRICDSEIHAILLRVLRSPQILNRFEELISLLKKNKSHFTTICATFLLTVLGYTVKENLITDLLGTNSLREMKLRRDPLFNQLIDFDKGLVKSRSSIAAQFILTDLTDGNIIISTAVQLAKAADKLSKQRNIYWHLIRDFMRFGQIQFILPHKNRRAFIIKYYESIKNLKSCKNNQFFWFQYAIANMVTQDYDMAKIHFDTAYSLAEKISTFDTYQIDNQYARFLLETAINDVEPNFMNNFKDARNILNRQVQRENRFYPYRIASLYYDFFEKFSSKFSAKDFNAILNASTHIVNRIDALSLRMQQNKYVIDCKLKLQLLIDEISRMDLDI